MGPALTPWDLPRIRRVGISAILCLQEPGADLPAAALEGIRTRCRPDVVHENLPIRDYDPDALIARAPVVLERLSALRQETHRVYVHCCEGVNRSPSIVLGALVLQDQLQVDAALAHLRSIHPAARPYPAFITWLRETFRAQVL